MKLQLSELHSNPFKKEINNGHLNEEIINKIQSNIKELGLMGSLPIFKREDKYYLIAGHHRVEALKREFGNHFEIEVTLHNYSDENILRGMVIENLTQRTDELVEVTENLNAIRKWLQSNINRSTGERMKSNREDGRGGKTDEQGSVRDIYSWLNKNGEVMSIGKISEYLKVYDNLDKTLLKKTIKAEGGEVEEDTLSIKEAVNLARLDKKEQKIMKTILDKTEYNKDVKGKLITEYLNAPDEIKDKVLNEKIDIKNIEFEIAKYNLHNNRKDKPEKDDNEKIDEFLNYLSFSISDTENN